MPNTLASPGFGGASAAPTPPTASSVILTYGESTSFQSLSEVGGYGGALAFPKAPEPTAAPATKGKGGKEATPAAAPTPVAIAIGATLSIVKPQDGPDINFVSGKGKKKRSRELPARALAYITLLPTHDATLESYPRIAVDIPREIASQYRDGEFGLALWNSGEKDAKYRLAVAELDTVTTPPPAPVRVASAASANPSPGNAAHGPTMQPLATGSPAATRSGPPGLTSPAPGTSGAPVAMPSAAPTLPPARIVFAGTATPLKLLANRPAVFAVYALPHPSTSAAPKAASGSAAPASSARPAASGSPAAASSGAPASPAPAKSP